MPQFVYIDDELVNGIKGGVPEFAIHGTLISWDCVSVDTAWLHILPFPIWNRFIRDSSPRVLLNAAIGPLELQRESIGSVVPRFPILNNIRFASIDEESVTGFRKDEPEHYATNGTLLSVGLIIANTYLLHLTHFLL